MYHCGLRFYFAGQSCRVFEIIREMPPLERFTHEFSESGKLDGALAAEADVIFANLQDMDVETDVRGLFAGKSGEKEFIIATETGVCHQLLKENPDKKFYPAMEKQVCTNMKKVTLDKVHEVLSDLDSQEEIILRDDMMEAAKEPLEKMLALAK